MIRITCLILAALLLPIQAYADEINCRSGTLTRTIAVEFDNPPSPLPCRVRYDKPDEGATEYPWNAQSTRGYCEDKAAELADKLESLGWSCTLVRHTQAEDNLNL